MTSGGARVRSGPAPSPNSARSMRRQLEFTVLPAEGRRGRTPKWPKPAVMDPETFQESPHSIRAKELWKEVWRFPQAVAWEPLPWRHHVVAEYCLVAAAIELDLVSNKSLVAEARRYREELGLTPEGMKRNGWVIGDVAEVPSSAKPTKRTKRTGGGSRNSVLEAVKG